MEGEQIRNFLEKEEQGPSLVGLWEVRRFPGSSSDCSHTSGRQVEDTRTHTHTHTDVHTEAKTHSGNEKTDWHLGYTLSLLS